MAARPNVLWVTIESLRADHTPMYGYDRETTPHTAREAARENATVFSPAVAQSMWTPAASASMLTGTYLSTHQLGQEGTPLSPLRSELQTLPERLREAGYRTALFSGNDYVGPTTGLDAGFETVEQTLLDTADFLPWNGSRAADTWRCALRRLWEADTARVDRLRRDVGHTPTAIVPRRFRRWVEDTPFFAYVHLQAPHHPYRPPGGTRTAFTDEIDATPDEAYDFVDRVYDGSAAIKRRIAESVAFDRRERDAVLAMYDAEIRFADRAVGVVIRAARAAAGENLIVVVTGDHGELFGERGVIGHNLLLHDGLIRVPLVVSGVDDLADSPETLTQHVDVTRTIAALAGCSTDGLDGRDLRDGDRPYAVSQRGHAPTDAYEEHDPTFSLDRVAPQPTTAVRTTEYKYLTAGDAEWLYALPDETRDALADHPEATARLRAMHDRLPTEWRAVSGERPAFDDATRDRLRDLGYVME